MSNIEKINCTESPKQRVFGAIWIGAPGSGKSTNAIRFAKEKGFLHISPGNLLRRFENDDTPQGREARIARQAGGILMDELNARLVVRELQTRLEGKAGFILDGFPVTPGACRQFELKARETFRLVQRVLVFDLPEKEAIRRLGGRRVHLPSGRTYHVDDDPPRVPNTDDVTGEPLAIRRDDNISVIQRRLAFHHSSTPQVVAFCVQRSVERVDIDAGGSREEVWEACLNAMGLSES